MAKLARLNLATFAVVMGILVILGILVWIALLPLYSHGPY